MRPFLKIFTINKELTQIQANVDNALTPLLRKILNDSNNVVETQLFTGTNVINHKLSRGLQGWLIIDKDTNANIWKTSSTETTATLETDANVNVKILFF